MQRKIKIIGLAVFLALMLMPFSSWAALLYLEPDSGTYGPGDSFMVDIKMDVESGCVNTIDGYISFSNDYLSLLDFYTGESMLSVWVEKPNESKLDKINEAGEIHFSGGIPGDPGESNILGKIVFQIPSLIVNKGVKEAIDINFTDKTKVYLNDGLGTEDSLTARGARIKYSNTPVSPNEDWRQIVDSDNIPPEPFVVELHQRDDIYGGKKYIIFSTSDKQSGVDHYEILEIKPEDEVDQAPKLKWYERLLNQKKEAPAWIESEMPYVLKDQSLESIVRVRAVDKAGNERTVEYIPPKEREAPPETFSQKYLFMLLLITVIIILLILISLYIIRRKILSRRKNEEE